MTVFPQYPSSVRAAPGSGRDARLDGPGESGKVGAKKLAFIDLSGYNADPRFARLPLDRRAPRTAVELRD